MQGALSLDEVLLRPLEPCPICLRKLQYVVGFKLIERYRVSELEDRMGPSLSFLPRQEHGMATSTLISIISSLKQEGHKQSGVEAEQKPTCGSSE